MAGVHLPPSRFVTSSFLEGFSHTDTIIFMTDSSDATNVKQSFVTPRVKSLVITATPLKSDVYMLPLYYLTIIMPVSERIRTP